MARKDLEMKRQEPQTIFQLQRDPPFYHDLPHSGLGDSGYRARMREPNLNADLQRARVLCAGKKEPLKTELEPLTQRGRVGKTGEMIRPREAIEAQDTAWVEKGSPHLVGPFYSWPAPCLIT